MEPVHRDGCPALIFRGREVGGSGVEGKRGRAEGRHREVSLKPSSALVEAIAFNALLSAVEKAGERQAR